MIATGVDKKNKKIEIYVYSDTPLNDVSKFYRHDIPEYLQSTRKFLKAVKEMLDDSYDFGKIVCPLITDGAVESHVIESKECGLVFGDLQIAPEDNPNDKGSKQRVLLITILLSEFFYFDFVDVNVKALSNKVVKEVDALNLVGNM